MFCRARAASIFAVLALCAMAAAGEPLAPLPAKAWDRAAAAHLLRRAGFGGTAGEVERIYQLGLDKAVDELVDYRTIAYEPPPPAVAPIVLEPFERVGERQMTEEERRAYQQRRQQAERQAHQEIRYWWIDRMANSPRPLEEKMTLFWHGLLTSGAREVRRAAFMLEQNELLRRHALGNFGELLRGISRDRAMLVYLDNARNNQRTPNENYARELLELFTLGEGTYSEDDVKAAARAFTGWSFDEDGFRVRPAMHDAGVKTFLGRTGDWDGDDIIHIILQQPACSRHLARRLLVCFCSPDPDRELVERLAAEIRRHGYELAPVMKTLLRSRAFYDEGSRGVLVKSPVELVIGTARQLGLPVKDYAAAERALANMGQELMQPPNVRGWPGGKHWINAATLFVRYNVVGVLIRGGPAPSRPRRAMNVDTQTDGSPAGGPTGVGMAGAATARALGEGGPQPTYDPLPVVRAYDLHAAGDIVDFYVQHLLAVRLSDEKRQALVDYLGAEFDPGRPRAAERIRTMVHLLCSTPEYQME